MDYRRQRRNRQSQARPLSLHLLVLQMTLGVLSFTKSNEVLVPLVADRYLTCHVAPSFAYPAWFVAVEQIPLGTTAALDQNGHREKGSWGKFPFRVERQYSF